MFEYPKPIRPADEDDPVVMLKYFATYGRWAWRTITAAPEMDTSDPRPKLMDLFGKTIIGLSGFVISLLVALVLQMFGVDDPVMGHLALVTISILLFLMCVYLAFNNIKPWPVRLCGILVPLMILSYATPRVDAWFVAKRKERGKPLTIEDLNTWLKNRGEQARSQSGDTSKQQTSKVENLTKFAVEIAPYVLERRLSSKVDGKETQVPWYGLTAIAHIYNGTSMRHQVKALEIVGDELADFTLYSIAFRKWDGTETINDMEADYERKRPYISLSWVAWPQGETRLDPGDELFIEFVIAEPIGSFGVFDFANPAKRYLGFSRWQFGSRDVDDGSEREGSRHANPQYEGWRTGPISIAGRG